MSSSVSRNRMALAAVCLSSLMFGLEISSVPAILPTLARVLHGDFRDMQWVMNAYTIACTSVLMGTGTVADRYGRKRLFLVCIALFGVTSLLCGLAWNMPVMIAGRFLQGASGGAMLICQVAVLSHQFSEPAERVKAFASWGVIFGIGLGFGPIIGGAIAALANWQWVFLVHGPLALVTLALAWRGAVESRDPHAQRLDIGGIVTLSLAVFGVAYVITQGGDMGFASTQAIVIAALSLLCLVAFVVIERLAARPMVDFSVFRIRPFSGALLGSAGMNASFWPFMIYLPVYFHDVLGYGDVVAGSALLAYTLPTLVVPPVAERLAHRYRAGWVIPGGLFTIGAGFFLMKWGSGVTQPSWLSMLPGCVVAGIGLGLTNTTVTNTTTGSVPSERAGMASGIDMSARMISLAINIALMGLILVAGTSAGLSRVMPGDAEVRHSVAVAMAGGQSVTLAPHVVHGALAQGFQWVMLYGGLSVWLLAGASLWVFGVKGSAREVNGAARVLS
ncbi:MULTISPECIES: MFS transporter [unclassified Dyella]|uniref:MFS transporter n=1 Tax=unclassified Dyella TaxID=2634549 RepID=UPI000CB3406B|nr:MULTISPECIES: MFS transporter [unclassified Dyella]MDR3444611.1 MFS transporter [Dyella sp.]PMQ05669.1 Multidrug resistance protein Stp [Dyella sp. AD56]